jgi:hypothetical protein
MNIKDSLPLLGWIQIKAQDIVVGMTNHHHCHHHHRCRHSSSKLIKLNPNIGH